MPELKDNVKYVKGVGEARAKSLNKLGIFTVEDLITYYPRNYEDRKKITDISKTINDEKYTIEAKAITSVTNRMLGRSRSIQKLVVKDLTDTCTITWFNQPYISKKIKRGEVYRFFGKMNVKIGIKEMASPVFDEINKNDNTGKIIPIYPLTYDVKATTIRKIIQNALSLIKNLEETIPDYLIEKYNLMPYDEATRQIHFPSSFEKFKMARKRLVFDELLSMQLGLLKLKGENNKEQKGIKYDTKVHMSTVINDLPYKLTKALTKTWNQKKQ